MEILAWKKKTVFVPMIPVELIHRTEFHSGSQRIQNCVPVNPLRCIYNAAQNAKSRALYRRTLRAHACTHEHRHTQHTQSFYLTVSGVFQPVWWIVSFIPGRFRTFIFGSALQKGTAIRDNTASSNPPSSKSPVWFKSGRTIHPRA